MFAERTLQGVNKGEDRAGGLAVHRGGMGSRRSSGNLLVAAGGPAWHHRRLGGGVFSRPNSAGAARRALRRGGGGGAGGARNGDRRADVRQGTLAPDFDLPVRVRRAREPLSR